MPAIAHWTLDDQGDTIAADVSGNGHTGTISGSTNTSGKIAGAFSFNGNDYISCPEALSGGATGTGLDMGTRDWSVTAWFKTTVSGMVRMAGA